MKFPLKCCALIILAAVLALALSLPGLARRPMHTDEAVNAYKFGDLLEKNKYSYDDNEFHGPTLNYLSLIATTISSINTFADTTEVNLRIVPVIFGVLLILLLLLLYDGLETLTIFIIAILTAISPAIVFYSRYYIHEMLLVSFTFGAITCGYRYFQEKNPGWVILTGAFLGLMYATKETCVIAFGAMTFALCMNLVLQKTNTGFAELKKTIKPAHAIAAVLSAVIVSCFFYSSFFTNPQGIRDSLIAYATYLNRATKNPFHIHPWYYYLKMLIYSKYENGPIWTEALIVILAVIGFFAAMSRKALSGISVSLVRFFAFYTLFITVIYSAIPYKTPWNMLSFLHGMIILAGFGASVIVKLQKKTIAKILVSLILIAACCHLFWQGYLLNFKYPADPRNPYVYAHTTPDIFPILDRIEDLAKVHPDTGNLEIHIIAPNYDHWPFPWYLRSFGRVGYFAQPTNAQNTTDVIIAHAAFQDELIKHISGPRNQDSFLPLFNLHKELRPQVKLISFVKKDLWERYQQNQVEQLLSQSESSNMKQNPQSDYLANSNILSIPNLHRFSHKAMATSFEVFIINEDKEYSSQAAQAAFQELDRLEQRLSHFIENSDISRINNLPANQPIKINLDTYQCLSLSKKIFDETGGAFDITVGTLMETWLNPDKTIRTPDKEQLNFARRHTGSNLIKLDTQNHAVELLLSPLKIDLGAIGKGFAVDCMADLLQQWDIDTALIHGGKSSVLALGSPPETKGWPLTLTNPNNRKEIIARLNLHNRALSGSGVKKGQHIIDPRSAEPIKGKIAAWSFAPDAATADALSTAFMVMPPNNIKQYCSLKPKVAAVVIIEDEHKDTILHFGEFADLNFSL